jgi:hypothetical protein
MPALSELLSFPTEALVKRKLTLRISTRGFMLSVANSTSDDLAMMLLIGGLS